MSPNWVLGAVWALPLCAAIDAPALLRQRCAACHGVQQQMNGLRLDDRAAALRGGKSGPAILPGNGVASPVVLRVAGKGGTRMPPTGPALAAAEIDALREWIDEGAAWADRGPHWAFAAPRGSVDSIDEIVERRLKKEGIAPAPEAPRETLLRRVSLDLTGLPPTPQEVRAFMTDASADAYQRQVDRLLNSPHYGERWARLWLDQARYADSDGFQRDEARPHAWRYRHWVIEALNRDMPFDRFTIEQIAGDLLTNATTDQKVATGFHRNTLTNREGGVDPESLRFDQIVDRVNTVATVWMGLTIGCAQCHDHKYDPTTQRDYYRLFAFFDSAEERDVEATLASEIPAFAAKRPEYLAKRRELLEEFNVPRLQQEWEAKMLEVASNPGWYAGLDTMFRRLRVYVDHGERILRTPPEKRTEEDSRRLTRFFIEGYGEAVTPQRYAEVRFKELAGRLREFEASYPQLTLAPTLAATPPRSTHVRTRGEFSRLGDEVKPGVPAFLPGGERDMLTRLDLARWLVDRNNPLTARVAVNRAWQEFFGRGLAGTSDDLGIRGEVPEYQNLLDTLAVRFMEQGWSLKQLHRGIVLSRTYRQSSRVRPELSERDPNNVLLARQVRLRLPAELIRDAALSASGLLSAEVGGRSVTTGHRRGLYLNLQRRRPNPQLMNFDAPNGYTTVCRRERSNTPLQALNLLNDPTFFEAAQALAKRAERESQSDRLGHLFRLALSREPGAGEREKLLAYFTDEKSQRGEEAAYLGAARVVLNLDAFITRE